MSGDSSTTREGNTTIETDRMGNSTKITPDLNCTDDSENFHIKTFTKNAT